MQLQAKLSGSGSPVVLLHGLFGAGRNFGALQASLAATFRVVSLDLRNHGASPHGTGMDYAALAADVAETLAGLELGACAVLGHSMGGKVAMRLALDQPALVERLVVADIAPVAYDGTFAAYAACMRGIDLAPGLSRGQAMAALEDTVPDPAIRGFLLMNLQFGAQPAWRIGLDEIIAGMADILDWPSTNRQFAGPALFVSGARSDYVTQSRHAGIRALFPAAAFATVADAGHWLHVDNPGQFLQIVQDFLGAPGA